MLLYILFYSLYIYAITSGSSVLVLLVVRFGVLHGVCMPCCFAFFTRAHAALARWFRTFAHNLPSALSTPTSATARARAPTSTHAFARARRAVLHAARYAAYHLPRSWFTRTHYCTGTEDEQTQRDAHARSATPYLLPRTRREEEDVARRAALRALCGTGTGGRACARAARRAARLPLRKRYAAACNAGSLSMDNDQFAPRIYCRTAAGRARAFSATCGDAPLCAAPESVYAAGFTIQFIPRTHLRLRRAHRASTGENAVYLLLPLFAPALRCLSCYLRLAYHHNAHRNCIRVPLPAALCPSSICAFPACARVLPHALPAWFAARALLPRVAGGTLRFDNAHAVFTVCSFSCGPFARARLLSPSRRCRTAYLPTSYRFTTTSYFSLPTCAHSLSTCADMHGWDLHRAGARLYALFWDALPVCARCRHAPLLALTALLHAHSV